MRHAAAGTFAAKSRYMTVQVFFTILAQFLALWFILEFVLQVLTAEKTSRPERNPRNLRLKI
jgi:hypothetical protein